MEDTTEHSILKFCYKMKLPDLSQDYVTWQKQVYTDFWISVPKSYDLNYDGIIQPFLNSGLVWTNATEESIIIKKTILHKNMLKQG